ncbi:hemolysin [Klebsiella pneumoniae]|nr:hemolysin [Klebsiella pneumoniae]
MFSLDSVLDDLWPQARPAPWQKSLLKRLFYEDEFQQFAAAHRHLKGLDMVEQVLEHLDILCTVSARDLEQIPEHGPLVIIRRVRWTVWRCCTPSPACGATLKS